MPFFARPLVWNEAEGKPDKAPTQSFSPNQKVRSPAGKRSQ